MAKKKAKSKRSKRSKRRGTGAITTQRLGRGMKGLGMLKGSTGAGVGAAIGAISAGLTTALIRGYVDPSKGETQKKVLKHAPLIGGGVGLLASVGAYFLGTTKADKATAGMTSAIAALGVSGTFFAGDKILEKRGAVIAASLAPTAPAAGAAGVTRWAPRSGRMNGIVSERRRQLSGPNGASPQLGSHRQAHQPSMNVNAFGTSF